MEKRIELTIDNCLESIAMELHTFSIIFGAVLIILGLIVLALKISKGKPIAGWICIAIGVVAVVSGIVQL